MDRKKIIIISVILILVLLGGAYWYFSKNISGPSGLSGLFPGESATSSQPTVGDVTPGETTSTEPIFIPGSGAAIPRLYELHKAPVAGVGFFETRDKKGSVINIAARYIERGLGNIFETPLSSYVESRIVNETRSHISEALWGNNGSSVVIRSVDDARGGIIKTRIINISAPTVSFARSTSTEALQSSFLRTEEISLPDFIPFMATSGDESDKIFYLENSIDASIGSISTFKDSGISKIFNSSFTEWLPQFPNQKLVTITTKPSGSIPGHMFFINPTTKSVTKILGGMNGLTTLTSRDGKLVLYSETKDNRPLLSFYDVGKQVSHSLYLQTLPEKCAWGIKNLSVVYCAVPQTPPAAIYPDQWYQGLVSFSDTLWEINATTLVAKKIMVPTDLRAPALDIINPSLSSDDGYFLFMNKYSMTPWVYKITEATFIPSSTSSPSLPVNPSISPTTYTSPKLPNAGIDPGMKKIK